MEDATFDLLRMHVKWSIIRENDDHMSPSAVMIVAVFESKCLEILVFTILLQLIHKFLRSELLITELCCIM